MSLNFSHLWQGAYKIPLFKWLYTPGNENKQIIHVYSMFMSQPAAPKIWQTGKRIFYTGEYIMDETHADVVVSFMPADDNTSARHVIKMPAPFKLTTSNNNRPGARYIQLRLQELDAIEWKINSLISSGNLALQSLTDAATGIRDYLLTDGNITPYADMMLSWAANRSNCDANTRKFCLFMVSNHKCKLRNDTFMLLTHVGHVVSAGGYMNNLAPSDQRPPDRMNHTEYINYLRQFRFMITFENKSLPHYHTEKITNAFEAGVIPIYWGDPHIGDMFDARSFIHIPTLDNPNHQWEAVKQAVARVQEANSDPVVYASYFQYPPVSEDKQKTEDARVAASLRAISEEML